MIDTIIIDNFKSIKHAKFDLQKVNLFIGPNNSGKTNTLNAITFVFNNLLNGFKGDLPDTFRRYYFGFLKEDEFIFKEPVSVTFIKKTENKTEYYVIEFWGLTKGNTIIKREMFAVAYKPLPEDFRIHDWKNFTSHFSLLMINSLNDDYLSSKLNTESSNFEHTKIFFTPNNKPVISSIEKTEAEKALFDDQTVSNYNLAKELQKLNSYLAIYNPNPEKIKDENVLTTENYLFPDASNLVSFLDNMRDEYPDIFQKINDDLKKCVSEASDIRFKKIKTNGQISKQLGIADKFGHVFWADELSEGTLYFLALLSIIHQPKPSRLLLIEEPEKGIHPRRLHEIMQFIFMLADEKEVQIILTSHSPQIVNEFEDIPQSVFVFEIIDGETKVNNLYTDIIIPSDKKSDEKGFPKIDYTKTLGEHWIYGFLGGVPL